MPESEFHALLLQRLDSQADDLKEIKAHVATTNGRVSKLELWKARTEGAQAANGVVGNVVLVVFASVAGGVAGYLISLIS